MISGSRENYVASGSEDCKVYGCCDESLYICMCVCSDSERFLLSWVVQGHLYDNDMYSFIFLFK